MNVTSHNTNCQHTDQPTYVAKILRHTQPFTEHQINPVYKLSPVRPFKEQWLLYVPPELILQTMLCVCSRAYVTIWDSSVGTANEPSCGLRRCTCRPFTLALWPTQHLLRFCSVGAKFSAPVQTGPGGSSSFLHSGYRVFPGGKATGA